MLHNSIVSGVPLVVKHFIFLVLLLCDYVRVICSVKMSAIWFGFSVLISAPAGADTRTASHNLIMGTLTLTDAAGELVAGLRMRCPRQGEQIASCNRKWSRYEGESADIGVVYVAHPGSMG